MTHPDVPPREEPWEREIQELLRSLPPVDPPEGFLQRAVDRRPKYAGRVCLVAVTTVMAAAVVVVGLGWVGDPREVAVPVRTMDERHGAVAPGMAASAAPADGAAFEPVADRSEVIELPPGFEPVGSQRDGEMVQFVYERAGRPVSVFVQAGPVDWDDLPSEGHATVEGRPVWTDGAARTVVLEAGEWVVCVVGLEVEDVLELMRHLPEAKSSVSVEDRLRALAADVARQAGFP